MTSMPFPEFSDNFDQGCSDIESSAMSVLRIFEKFVLMLMLMLMLLCDRETRTQRLRPVINVRIF